MRVLTNRANTVLIYYDIKIIRIHAHIHMCVINDSLISQFCVFGARFFWLATPPVRIKSSFSSFARGGFRTCKMHVTSVEGDSRCNDIRMNVFEKLQERIGRMVFANVSKFTRGISVRVVKILSILDSRFETFPNLLYYIKHFKYFSSLPVAIINIWNSKNHLTNNYNSKNKLNCTPFNL